jgi:hypothetical protein
LIAIFKWLQDGTDGGRMKEELAKVASIRFRESTGTSIEIVVRIQSVGSFDQNEIPVKFKKMRVAVRP